MSLSRVHALAVVLYVDCERRRRVLAAYLLVASEADVGFVVGRARVVGVGDGPDARDVAVELHLRPTAPGRVTLDDLQLALRRRGIAVEAVHGLAGFRANPVAVGRRPHGNVSWVWFLDADGEVMGKKRLDPFDVEPFDRDLYAPVMNAGYSLKLADYSRSVGTQLLWSTDAFHDASRNLLLLAMTRPVDSPIREVDTWSAEEGVFCHVEDRWVSVALREE